MSLSEKILIDFLIDQRRKCQKVEISLVLFAFNEHGVFSSSSGGVRYNDMISFSPGVFLVGWKKKTSERGRKKWHWRNTVIRYHSDKLSPYTCCFSFKSRTKVSLSCLNQGKIIEYSILRWVQRRKIMARMFQPYPKEPVVNQRWVYSVQSISFLLVLLVPESSSVREQF